MSPKEKGSIYGDVWKTKRDTSKDPKRAPGPIDLSRYVAHLAYSGPQTFCKVPVCLNQADLRAGKVDVAICGVPIDTSVGQRGAAHGPMAIRTAEKYIPGPRKGGFPHQHVRIDPFEVLRVVDYGDAAVHPLSIEESHQPIRQVIREIAETGAVPMVLGGDHSLMWPSCAALADVYGAGKIGVVHFDAHADCSPDVLGHLHAHGTPIRRLIEEEHVPARNFIQVGLRGYYPSDDLFAWMQQKGMRSHYMAEVERKGFEAVMQLAIEEALDGPEHLYVSVDIDALDPAYAPGTGTPEPGGLTTRELFPMIRRIAHEIGIVGMEVVEVAPAHDPGYTTALNAHRIVLEALTGMAMRKKGIKGRHYLHPIAAGERSSAKRGSAGKPRPAGAKRKR